MRDDAVYVEHMLESIERIESYTEDVDERAFKRSPLIQDAVIRHLEVVGEAATRVSDDAQDRYDDIPWRDITGMRNKLIHGYFGVDVDVVWETVVEDLPPLKAQLERIRDEHS